MNDHRMDLYKIFVFYGDRKFKMAAISRYSFNIEPYGKMLKKMSPLKLVNQFKANIA